MGIVFLLHKTCENLDYLVLEYRNSERSEDFFTIKPGQGIMGLVKSAFSEEQLKP